MRSKPSFPALAALALCSASLFMGSAQAQVSRDRMVAPIAGTPLNGMTDNGTVLGSKGPGIPPVNAQQSVRSTNNTEVFRLLSLSGQINAPVTPAYNEDGAYRTFAGQPMKGADAVLAQSIDGAP